MFTAEYKGINSFLVGASRLLLENGVKRITRGQVCWELPGPFMFKITNPTSRIVTLPQRKWNPTLPFAESLWIASGRNNLNMINHYLKNIKNFSDDGLFMRGGYGPRLRAFDGNANDYKIGKSFGEEIPEQFFSKVDQFYYIEKSFHRDINTRQAIINIGDPPKDCVNFDGSIKETRDFPCTRLLHFMKQPFENKLDLTVYLRSNDILWGASAVNIFNFTFMQEYFAKILNLEIGDYYHIANNFHYYENFKNQILEIAEIDETNDIGYNYSKSFNNLEEFDNLISRFSTEEEALRVKKTNKLIDFNDDFFDDWYKVIFHYNTKQKVNMKNPILNNIIN